MHRLPGDPPPCHATPVLLIPGVLTDSTAFVLDAPCQSLGFALLDNCYDVWLGNVRGNSYGKRHRTLDTTSGAFWNFTFHEHAVYDVPAQIDYILDVTGERTLLYIGWAQGTLIFFTMLSEKPQYNQKIRAFAGLAPYRKILGNHVPIMQESRPLGYQFLLRATKKSQKYDFGPAGNFIRYKQAAPPEYNIHNVKIDDIAFFWSEGDNYVLPSTVQDLISELGWRVKFKHYIPDPDFSNLNFIMSTVGLKMYLRELIHFFEDYINLPQ
ncbi:lipase 1-like [Ornithodoros turicata]|uniref:lipase 1-like n=1 Tax=Ornithodoros turicata TaxID=34597 RepID=UPI003139AE8A